MDENGIEVAFVNYMAEAASLLTTASEQQIKVLEACAEADEIYKKVNTEIEKAKENDCIEFLNVVRELLLEAQMQSDGKKYTYAKALCKCLDFMVTFSYSAEGVWKNGRISLYRLFCVESDICLTVISELNQNKKETGICVVPKFPVGNLVSDCRTRNLHSRDSLFGINGELNNITYYLWNENTPEVHHVFLAAGDIEENDTAVIEETKIAYTPLTDKKDILILSEEYKKSMYNMQCNVKGVNGIRQSDYIEERFKKSWIAASEEGVDIFFAPEMLATEQMAAVENGGSVFLQPLLKEALVMGNRPPRLTILPSYWKDEKNSVFIFDETGRLCGKQDKGTPYVNVKAGWAEAIDVEKAPEVLLVHMINQQRIAIVICAEFLSNETYVREFLCEQLGATLILVPAYSSGEQDFLNMLSVLKPYGTSVVWGNCCGAAHTNAENKRIIGGCSLAGTDEIHRMGAVCKCGFFCGDKESCFFLIKIPANIFSDKPQPPLVPEILHLCGP